MQCGQPFDQHITMRLLGGNPRRRGGKLGENIGQQSVVDVQMNGFPDVGIAGAFQNEAYPDPIERGFEAR